MPPGSRSNRRDQAAGRPLPVHRQVKGENIFQESILGTFWPPAIFVLCYFSRLSNSYSSLQVTTFALLLFLPFFTFHLLQAANWGIENLARVKHLANSMSVSSRWPSGVGAMVASSPPRFSPQMLIRATSSRSRVIFSELSCCCEFEIISSYLFLVRHQRCPCDQLDLL